MGDVAQILGVSSGPSRAQQLMGMPQQVMDLLGPKQKNNNSNNNNTAELPPIVPAADVVRVGNKNISKTKTARPWVWAPFTSSSRIDGALFHHWVRANVEYPDYPYARFDVHLDPVVYTDEEYQRYLASSNNNAWTKSETDKLMDLARRFELRWPVIHDRWIGQYLDNGETVPKNRNVEDLQHRYYQVAAVLNQSRISQQAAAEVQALTNATDAAPLEEATENLLLETAAAKSLASADPIHQPLMANIGTGSTNKPVFDLQYERQRRAHLQAIWKRTKAEEQQETALRIELKQVEAQLKKLKKQGGHILAAAAAKSAASSRSVSPMPTENAISAIVPTPTPGYPFLQSGRLAQPTTGVNKALLNRMHTVLADMNVPSTLSVATKRVCDVYDTVRQDALVLLVTQKNLLQKEGLIESKRLKLAKLGGNVRVVQEETLLDIAPAHQAPQASNSAASTAKQGKTQRAKVKSSGSSSTTTKEKSSSADKDAAAVEPAEDAKPSKTKEPGKATKKVVKRKRKSESTKASAKTTATEGDEPASTTTTKTVKEGATKSSSKKKAKKS